MSRGDTPSIYFKPILLLLLLLLLLRKVSAPIAPAMPQGSSSSEETDDSNNFFLPAEKGTPSLGLCSALSTVSLICGDTSVLKANSPNGFALTRNPGNLLGIDEATTPLSCEQGDVVRCYNERMRFNDFFAEAESHQPKVDQIREELRDDVRRWHKRMTDWDRLWKRNYPNILEGRPKDIYDQAIRSLFFKRQILISASKTQQYKVGNCLEQSHLAIARLMARNIMQPEDATDILRVELSKSNSESFTHIFVVTDAQDAEEVNINADRAAVADYLKSLGGYLCDPWNHGRFGLFSKANRKITLYSTRGQKNARPDSLFVTRISMNLMITGLPQRLQTKLKKRNNELNDDFVKYFSKDKRGSPALAQR